MLACECSPARLKKAIGTLVLPSFLPVTHIPCGWFSYRLSHQVRLSSSSVCDRGTPGFPGEGAVFFASAQCPSELVTSPIRLAQGNSLAGRRKMKFNKRSGTIRRPNPLFDRHVWILPSTPSCLYRLPPGERNHRLMLLKTRVGGTARSGPLPL